MSTLKSSSQFWILSHGILKFILTTLSLENDRSSDTFELGYTDYMSIDTLGNSLNEKMHTFLKVFWFLIYDEIVL